MDTEYRIFVARLPSTITNSKLVDHFSIHGPVIYASVARTRFDQSKTFGFVCFLTRESRDDALVNFDPLLEGEPIVVQRAHPRPLVRSVEEKQLERHLRIKQLRRQK